MNKIASHDNVVIYQSRNGALELKTDSGKETVWANLMQIANLFDTDKSGISRHINNILKEGELPKTSTVAKFATVQKEGNREITRHIEYYNLDMILSVGYRVNSKQATHFRQWATQTLKKHIVDGYTINRHRIKKNYETFLQAVDDVKKLLPDGFAIDKDDVLELITLFSDTWLSLDAYDKDQLTSYGTTKKKIKLTAEKLSAALLELKQNLMSKGEATDIFGIERSKDSVAGIIGNVMQSFGNEDVYPSVEEKAAHLLYFFIKNHPFTDGNKRSGAYAFIWFLKHTKILDLRKITPPALTALTLLIAESNPKDKDKMTGLICSILSKKSAAKTRKIK